MKQNYVKPTIIVERFALTQSIATSCGAVGGTSLGKPTNWSKNTCAWDAGGILVFTEAMADLCVNVQVGENEIFDGVCYNNPDGAMIFSSF